MAKTEVYEFEEDDKRGWWTLVLGGVLSVLFGFVTIIWPHITVGVLALLLAVFIGVYGVSDIVRAVRRFGTDFFSAILRLLLGLLEVGVSVYLLRHVGSGLAIATLALVIAISFITRGVVAIVLAFDSNVGGGTRWLNAIIGALAIFAGLVVVWYPGAATLAWVWVLGFYALVAGAMEIALGFMAKDALDGRKR